LRLDPSASGQEILEHLERANLFIVPLDDKRQWYRYHHLFADVLQVRLMKEQPEQVPILHRRASEWYEQNNLPTDAVRHALAAEDFERAASLIELAWPAILRSFQVPTFIGWMKALPDKLIHARPVLSAGYAWALLFSDEFEAAGDHLRAAERWLDANAETSEHPDFLSDQMVVVDEEEFRLLPATIATVRAFHAQTFGDVAGTMKYARRALDLLPEDDYFRRAIPEGVLGFAYWARGDLEAAYRSLTNSRAIMQMTGDISSAISGTSILAYIKATQGHLREAISIYEQSLQLATAQGEPPIQGTADLYLGLGELHVEQGNLDIAIQHVVRSEALAERAAFDAYQYRWRVVRARLKEVQGDLDGALALLDDAERVYTSGVLPDVRPVAALKARVWIVQGRLAKALTWSQARSLSDADNLSYLREFEHVTLVRLFIAQYRKGRVNSAIQQAAGLLERLLKAAEEGERMGSAIEILVLQALAHQAQGDVSAALVPLERALTLAEPEGYVRIFVDEGAPMTQLLLEAAAREIMPDFTDRLLTAFESEGPFDYAQDRQTGKGNTHLSSAPSPQPLIEPLSQRELDVLRLFKTELSGPEIADELMIALSTVRTHTKNIYSKLNVNNRRAAVKRAKELDLI
jgi:LuxR family maltose regulon positive regulatory protein